MLRNKMTEYIANAAQLGFLIDHFNQTVHDYRLRCAVEFLEDPAEVSAEPEMPEFILS